MTGAPLWVVGGEQRGVPHWTREWKLFKQALVVKFEAGRVERVLEYETPPEHRPDDAPSIVFKAATMLDDTAYLCTQTEVLVCDFPSFAIRRVISHPFFNDLHHVAVAPDGRLFVAVTGLDAVAELQSDGALVRLIGITGEPVWDRFSRDVDYRKVATTKPHRAHPNYVFFIDGEPWVTRFQHRDAVPVDDLSGSRRFEIGGEAVHDGHLADGRVFFTAVDGRLVTFDVATHARIDYDLNRAVGTPTDRPLGWCRGVLPQGREAWVGFTRIRYTALRQNVDWVRRGFKKIDRLPPRPTRLARYDLQSLALLEEIELEDVGLNTIFSVHSREAAR